MDTGKALKKLKSHPEHKSKSPEELRQLASELTTPAKIREKFTRLLDVGQNLALEIVEEDDDDLLHTLEFNAQHEKVKYDTARAIHLPVKLSLRKLRMGPPLANSFASMLKFEYGALHAAVVVEDIIIEWGREELVEPRIDPLFRSEFQANVEEQGEWYERQRLVQQEMSLADRQRNSQKKLDIVCRSMEEKTKMIDNLVEVIVDYNRNKEYSVFNCNCQHFARDALAALGINKQVKFNGRLKERFEQLKTGNEKVPKELSSHENLDAYVEGFKQELSRQDLEYLQCLYFQTHLPAIEASDHPEEWECDIPTCKSAELDVLIQERRIPFNQVSSGAPPGSSNTPSARQAPQFNTRRNSTNTSASAGAQNRAGSLHPEQYHPLQEGPHLVKPTTVQGSTMPPGSQETPQKDQVLPCINNCGLLGNTDTAGLCTPCHYKECQAAHDNERKFVAKTSPTLTSTATNDVRRKCLTPGCQFYGTKHTKFHCSQCFEGNMENILKEEEAPTCYQCERYYGNVEYQGLCHGCFMEKTKTESSATKTSPRHYQPTATPSNSEVQTPIAPPRPSRADDTQTDGQKCYECKHFFANVEYQGLCHGCFMFRTERETLMKGVSPLDISPPVSSPVEMKQYQTHAQASKIPYVPQYEICLNQDCNNLQTETGYCDMCNLPRTQPSQSQHSFSTAVPQGLGNRGNASPVSPHREPQRRNECFMCTGSQLCAVNVMCERHREMALSMHTLTDSQDYLLQPGQNPAQPSRQRVQPEMQQQHRSIRADTERGFVHTTQASYAPVPQRERQFEVQRAEPQMLSYTRQAVDQRYVERKEQSQPSNHRAPPVKSQTETGPNTSSMQPIAGSAGNLIKELCATPGCSFKGYRELDLLCPECYEDSHPGQRAPDYLPLL